MKNDLPTWSVYGNYSSNNYGAHALRFDVSGDTFWFSYKTLIAFQKGHGDIVVHENDWSTTTGKHLNAIDNGAKKARVSGVVFEKLFAKAFGRQLKAAA